MVKASFYQLTSTELKRALPKLLGKALDLNKRVLILVENIELKNKLDSDLWSATRIFLPHCLDNDNNRSQTPIIISSNVDETNDFDFVFVVDGIQLSKNNLGFERLFDIFSGANNTELNSARTRYKHYKNLQLEVDYYQQQANGSWQKS